MSRTCERARALDRSRSNNNPHAWLPVAEDGVEADDEFLLLRREGAALEVRPEVVDPPEAAALAAALQAGVPGHVAPRALPAPQHVRHQLLVLLRRPQPLAQLRRRPCIIAAVRRRWTLRLPHCCSAGPALMMISHTYVRTPPVRVAAAI